MSDAKHSDTGPLFPGDRLLIPAVVAAKGLGEIEVLALGRYWLLTSAQAALCLPEPARLCPKASLTGVPA